MLHPAPQSPNAPFTPWKYTSNARQFIHILTRPCETATINSCISNHNYRLCVSTSNYKVTLVDLTLAILIFFLMFRVLCRQCHHRARGAGAVPLFRCHILPFFLDFFPSVGTTGNAGGKARFFWDGKLKEVNWPWRQRGPGFGVPMAQRSILECWGGCSKPAPTTPVTFNFKRIFTDVIKP